MAARRTRQKGGFSLVRLLRRLIFAGLAVTLLLAVAIGAIAYREIRRSLPALDAIVEYTPRVASQVFSDDGTMIAEFFSEKRYLVPIERIPTVVRHAFIAAEDDGFYRHRGVDVISMVRALLNNLVAGSKVQGASTITQQVVKSLLLTPTKSYERKLKEIILAVRLERELSKDQILGLYLNHIYLGSGAYGVAAAAYEYFGKKVEDLSLAEAALLAGLPQAPSSYSPFRHWPRAKARQRYVLNRMYEANFISRDDRDAAMRQPLALATRKEHFTAAPYFVEHVRRELEERLGYNALYEMGLRVYTSVNLPMQRAAEETLRSGLVKIADRHNGYRDAYRNFTPEERDLYLRTQESLLQNESLEPLRSYDAVVTSVRNDSARVQVGPFAGELRDDSKGRRFAALQLGDLVRVRLADGDSERPVFTLDTAPSLEGALVALDPRTGFVKALVGGYDYDRSNFNRATQARRQPGSAFKPLVYAAALDRHFSLNSVVIDEPISYWTGDKLWQPQNFEKKFFGPTTLRTALIKSRNVVTVKVAQSVGIGYLIKYLRRFGLTGKLGRNLSIALGSEEVTPLELAVAYATLANNGRRPVPHFITKITDQNGRALETVEPELTDAIPMYTAYAITTVLQDVIRQGTGKRAALGRPAAGKTGTTNDQHDAWFVGYTPQLLAAVWVGFDSKRSIGKKETGGRAVAPIWKDFMQAATQGLPVEDFQVPEGFEMPPPRQVEPRVQIAAGEDGAQPTTVEQPSGSSALDFLRSDF